MPARYEIQDTAHPHWRGQRFATRERAERELARSDAPAGRFVIVERGRPRPDYDPRVDHPERYTDGPI